MTSDLRHPRPADAEQRAGVESTQPGAGPAATRSKVLVVDDEKSIRRSIKAFLRNAGYDVRSAEDALGAQALLAEDDYDVVLSDIILPGGSGVALLKAIKSASPEVQVIMMTGEPGIESASEAVRCGACDYLSKPIPKNAILRSVGNAVTIKRIDTERRKLEQANARYQATLEANVVALTEEVERRRAAEQAKNDFVSMVSHNLRTPLAIAKDAFGLLADGTSGTLTESQHHILDIAGRNMELLADLVDDLLDVARIDAGRLVIEAKPIDLVALTRQVCVLLEPLAAAKGLTLELTGDPAPLPVQADWNRMFHVLSNIGDNAIKFTEQGGVSIELRQSGEDALVVVRDTGTGIAPEDLPLVFDRFPRLKRVYRPGQKGSGLGLAITKDIVAMHGGSIAVSSEPGKGAAFTIRLPQGEAQQTDARLPDHDEEPERMQA